MKDIIEKIYEYSLEEIMGDRFASYAKEIIQDTNFNITKLTTYEF